MTIRIPWMQLGIVDPSSHRALVPRLRDGRPVASAVPISAVGLRALSSRDGEARARLTWDGWNTVRATERLKTGASVFGQALGEVDSPRSER